MRAPFRILAIPYRKSKEFLFCVFHRADHDQYQFVAGGGENEETPAQAAIREIAEETGITVPSVISLTSMAYVPANVISDKHRKLWGKELYVIPEYTFGFMCNAEISLSDEHTGYQWLRYEEAMAKLTWDSNRTALYELRCRLLEEGRQTGMDENDAIPE